MKQLVQKIKLPFAVGALAVAMQVMAVQAQSITMMLDKVIENDTLKVSILVKQTGMVPTGDPLSGQAIALSATIDLKYDPNSLVYPYGAHPTIATNPVYESYPRVIGALSTTYGSGNGTAVLTPSRVPNPSAGNAADVCNPPDASCLTPYTRTSMADGSLSSPWIFGVDSYKTLLTHHYVFPSTETTNGTFSKASTIDVEVDSTTLAICFVQSISPPVTSQCCRTNASAGSEVGGFCNIESPVLLPVELADFSALVDNGDVVLNWSTASETNNAGFAIEHGLGEGDLFEQIGYVDGAGNSQSVRNYSFEVKGLDIGTHRFRLKQLDFDGSFKYSSTVEATIELAGTHRLGAAYPNPFNPSTTFELVVGREQLVRIDIINALGQRVQRLFDGTMEANKPTNFVFRADNLPTGLYFYRVIGENFAQTRQVLLVK